MRLPFGCGWWPVDLATKEVMWLAILHFGPYWARQAVREAWSDQSAGHVSPLSVFLQKSELEGDGCRVSHAVERPILLFVPGWVIILGMKTQGQNCLSRAWVYWLCSPDVTRQMGFPLGKNTKQRKGKIQTKQNGNKWTNPIINRFSPMDIDPVETTTEDSDETTTHTKTDTINLKETS